MNTLLISSAEALSLAFTPAEFQREELIPAVTIETAQLRYLKPAFGPLYDCLNEPRYEAFVERYVKPALACYVRALVIDARAAAVGPSGIVQARTQYTEAAPAEAAGRLRRQALRDAETASGRLSRVRSGPRYPPPGPVQRRSHPTRRPAMKQLTVLLSVLVGLLAPVQTLVCCALAFVCIDFVTGVVASRVRARRQRARWAFESAKAWQTVYKIVLVTVGIALTWLIDRFVLPFAELHLANLFTGFVCGVELWSYLENAAELSDHPLFRGLQKLMKQKIDNQLNHPEP